MKMGKLRREHINKMGKYNVLFSPSYLNTDGGIVTFHF